MDKEELLRTALRDLNKKYIPGLYEFLYQTYPELYSQLQGIEAGIDNAFLTGSIGELKRVLREYWTFHLKCIDIFREADIPIDRDRVRSEMLERVNA